MRVLLTWAAICFVGAGGAGGVDLGEDLQVFGHMTLAYGESDLGTILGISEDGTTELSTIAVQFRWQISERDTAVVQFSHERRGDELFFPDDGELRVDWAFYEHHLGSDTSVKVGRLNVPLGIYNEVRDVGTVLPFFQLPISVYSGVLSSAETVDGVSVCHMLAPRTDWDLEVNFHYGGWDTAQQRVNPASRFGIETLEARAEDGFGLQLWLGTPLKGLRLGAGAQTWLLDGPLTREGSKDRWDSYQFSFDWTRNRWMLRSELRRWRFDQDFGAFLRLPFPLPARAERDGFYVQAGYWMTPKVGLFAQYQELALRDDVVFLSELEEFHQELALSLNYRPRPDIVAKVEYHSADTRIPLGVSSLSAAIGAPPVAVDWFIVAFSVSF